MRCAKSMFTLIAAFALLNGGYAAAADKLAPGRVASQAEIWLPLKTRFSGFALPAGQYLLQHRINGSDHLMAFVQLKARDASSARGTHKVMAVMVRCRLEPLQAKASQTAFYSVAEGNANRAIKLEIKGESVAHVFPMPAAVAFAR